MGFEFREKLTSGEKKRRAAEYTKWLQENDYLPDYSKTLLEVRNLILELNDELHKQGDLNLAASKLASHIEELIQTIKA